MEVVLGAMVVVFAANEVMWRHTLRKLTEEFARERLELLTRAMHPQVVFPPRIERDEPPEPPEPDDFERVGRIDFVEG